MEGCRLRVEVPYIFCSISYRPRVVRGTLVQRRCRVSASRSTGTVPFLGVLGSYHFGVFVKA